MSEQKEYKLSLVWAQHLASGVEEVDNERNISIKRALDGRRCLAIFLGASSWCGDAGYMPAPEFRASATAWFDYFTSTNSLGIPKEQILCLFDSKDSAEAQLRRVRAFLAEKLNVMTLNGGLTDLFVIGISHGDGTPQNRRDLHLIIYATEQGYIDGTGLSIRQLATTLTRGARKLRRYVILDCCFSGAALAYFQSGPRGAAALVAADIRRTASEFADPAAKLEEVGAGSTSPTEDATGSL